MKYCKSCNKTKPVREFGRDKYSLDGLRFYCKECATKLVKRWVDNFKKRDVIRYRDCMATTFRRFRRTVRGKYWTLKYNSKKRGMPFNINIDDFIKWYQSQPYNCYYCKLQFDGDNRQPSNPRAPTIDRKDNDREYTLDNIVIACRRCNTIKGNWFTDNEMLEIANKYLLNRPGEFSKWQ